MSNETQQTAVDFLKKIVKEMINNGGDHDLFAVLWHIEQAKEIEKNQIIKAFDDGKWDSMEFKGTESEHYYSETYGGNK